MKLLAITSCPAGIAHTYIAAEALAMEAKSQGIEIKIETRGLVGVENPISKKDIDEADLLIIASDTSDCNLALDRFKSIPILKIPISEAIKSTKLVLTKAIIIANGKERNKEVEIKESYIKIMLKREKWIKKVYKEVMTGISYALPLIMLQAILFCLAAAFKGSNISIMSESSKLFFKLWYNLGTNTMIYSLISGFIAYGVVNKPGLVPGIIIGLIVGYLGLGFISCILAGLIVGYIMLFFDKLILVPKLFGSIKNVFILPTITIILSMFLVVFILKYPLRLIDDGYLYLFSDIKGPLGIIVGTFLGIMIAWDLGGPVNKIAYLLAIGSISSGKLSTTMAAVMVAGMVPPLGIVLARICPANKIRKFTKKQYLKGFISGLIFITEGAIPFIDNETKNTKLAFCIGSGITAAFSVLLGLSFQLPQGGILILIVPETINNLFDFLIVLIVGMLITTFLIYIFDKKILSKDGR
ncbi:MAG TPA: fructose-specific PTS transporter subunit EIIC [Clostridiaceae bacterium]